MESTAFGCFYTKSVPRTSAVSKSPALQRAPGFAGAELESRLQEQVPALFQASCGSSKVCVGHTPPAQRVVFDIYGCRATPGTTAGAGGFFSDASSGCFFSDASSGCFFSDASSGGWSSNLRKHGERVADQNTEDSKDYTKYGGLAFPVAGVWNPDCVALGAKKKVPKTLLHDLKCTGTARFDSQDVKAAATVPAELSSNCKRERSP